MNQKLAIAFRTWYRRLDQAQSLEADLICCTGYLEQHPFMFFRLTHNPALPDLDK
jgi:hypothetical protein